MYSTRRDRFQLRNFPLIPTFDSQLVVSLSRNYSIELSLLPVAAAGLPRNPQYLISKSRFSEILQALIRNRIPSLCQKSSKIFFDWFDDVVMVFLPANNVLLSLLGSQHLTISLFLFFCYTILLKFSLERFQCRADVNGKESGTRLSASRRTQFR